MLDCRDVARLVSRSMDATLPIGERIGVRIHLLMCRFCARYERQLLLIREIVRRLSAEEEGPAGFSGETLSVEARERMKRSLRNA